MATLVAGVRVVHTFDGYVVHAALAVFRSTVSELVDHARARVALSVLSRDPQ